VTITTKQLGARSKGLGGSDIASVLNQKPYGCARRLFYGKTNTKPDYEEAHNYLFDRGDVLEPYIIQRYEDETGFKVEEYDTQVSEEYPWARVNVDGLVNNPIIGRGVLECKTRGQYVFNEIKKTGLPPSDILQIHQGMLVHKLDWGAIAILHPDTFRFITFDVERDEKIIDIIKKEGAKFWKMKGAGIAPDRLDLSDKRCSNCIFKAQCQGQALLDAFEEVEDDGVADGSQYDDLVFDWTRAQQASKEAKATENDLKAQVQLVMDKIPQMYSNGYRVDYMPQERVTFNSKKFKEDYPDIYGQYAKTSVARVMRAFSIRED